MSKKCGIVQPYFFPYYGYFQLINLADHFVFYDDVNFISRGWINRNYILVNKKRQYITVPCSSKSQNKLINEVELSLNSKIRKKLLKTIRFNYSKAPFFDSVFTLIENVLKLDTNKISELSIYSIKSVLEYLNISTETHIASELPIPNDQDRSERLIEITKFLGCDNYVNPIGGTELYDKEYFEKFDIKLTFIKPSNIKYNQFDNQFVSNLSIIDVLMFNRPEIIKLDFLSEYELI